MAALRQSWRFDEFYSLFAVEGLDKDGDGALAPGELRPLAELNVTSLKEYNYFTEITADGAALSFSTVSAYEARYEDDILRSEEHTSELQSLMRISYAVFCLKKKKNNIHNNKKDSKMIHMI